VRRFKTGYAMVFSFDTYSELQERINVGSADVSSYSRRTVMFQYNYDAMLNFNKDLTEKLNLEGNIGFNLRNNTRNNIFAATNGGLSLSFSRIVEIHSSSSRV
jgi:hypothetical protein